MRKNKTPVFLMTALLLMVIALTELILIQREHFPFSVEITTRSGTETIACWRRDGCYYVFLPGYADPEQSRLVTNPLFPVSIDGRRIGEGMGCGEFPFFEKLPIVCKKWGKTYEEWIVFCQSANVPTLYIETASGAMDYIHEEKGNAEGGSLRLYDPAGQLDSDAQIRIIKGRGNSTWDSEKKPYSLELTQRTDLLGMGRAKNWILLANYFDPTNMGNKMSYDFAAAVGCAYTPECQWVDLYLNGNYAGLYVLSERDEVDAQRVDIPETGSFLISSDLAERREGRGFSSFLTSEAMMMRIRYAGMPEEQIAAIWKSAEDAIRSEDGIDPRTGKSWDELIDVHSWAQQFLLWEVFAEFDAGALSKFFYYDGQTGLVCAGPVWDMDNILNNCGRHPANILAAQRRYIWGRNQESLFYRLWQKDSFRETVKELYREEYRPRLGELQETGMEAYLNQIRRAADMNGLRWNGADTGFAVEEMRQYLAERLAFLDAYWEAEEDYCVIEVSADSQWRSFAVRRGDSAEFMPNERGHWVDYETGEPFDVTAPVTCNRIVLLKDDGEEWQE